MARLSEKDANFSLNAFSSSVYLKKALKSLGFSYFFIFFIFLLLIWIVIRWPLKRVSFFQTWWCSYLPCDKNIHSLLSFLWEPSFGTKLMSFIWFSIETKPVCARNLQRKSKPFYRTLQIVNLNELLNSKSFSKQKLKKKTKVKIKIKSSWQLTKSKIQWN